MRVGASLRNVSVLAVLLVAAVSLPGAASAAPPKLSSPTVKISVGEIKSVEVEVEAGKEIGWAPGFPPEHVYLDEGKPHRKDTARFIVSPKRPGVYRLVLWTVGEREYSTLVIDADGPVPVPTPKVDPDPKPEPIPPPKPKPDPTPVVVEGLRVVFWFESRSRLTPAESAVIYSPAVQEYLDAKCAKHDGQPEWRRWDQDVTLVDLSRELVALHAKIKASVPESKMPAMVVFNDASGDFYPLTAKQPDGTTRTLTEEQVLKILKQYGGE